MVVAPWTGMPPLEPLFAFQIGKNWPSYGLTLYLWESKSTFYLPGGGGGGPLLPSLLFSSYLWLKQSNFEDKGIYRTRMDLPSFLNERMQICMHAWAHACTLIVAGDEKM